MMEYQTNNVCSQKIEFDIINGKVHNVRFTAGCAGNLAGITSLIDGMPVQDVIEKLKGIKCGLRGTSCPDQLAKALEERI